jgi:hypothetical protein
MLAWTGSGAVEAPTSVQIRVSAGTDRLPAGAPPPSRAMTRDELLDNVHWFAVRRAGPRAAACTQLVLSGVDAVPDWAAVVPAARGWGVQRITVHGRPRPAPMVDGWVVVVRQPSDAVARASWAIPLEEEVLPRLPALVEAARALRPPGVTFTWPFPSHGVPPPPPAPVVVDAARWAIEASRAAGLAVVVKGLPPCTLASIADGGALAWRTRNRWVVDADHQREQALLFFPDILRFARPDSCRVCAWATRCDGVAAPWLDAGLAGPLTPIRRPTP